MSKTVSSAMQSSSATTKPATLPPFQFSLATLLGVVTLVPAELALLVNFPELGLPVGVFLLPALARTWALAAMRRDLQRPVEPLRILFASLGMMWLLFVLATGLFFVALIFAAISLPLSPVLSGIVLLIGLGIAFLMPVGLYIKLWPRRVGKKWMEDAPWT